MSYQTYKHKTFKRLENELVNIIENKINNLEDISYKYILIKKVNDALDIIRDVNKINRITGACPLYEAPIKYGVEQAFIQNLQAITYYIDYITFHMNPVDPKDPDKYYEIYNMIVDLLAYTKESVAIFVPKYT